MSLENLNVAAAYEIGIDWSCYYTKAIIAPTLYEINKYYDFTWTQILILELLLREKQLHMSEAARRIAIPPQNLTKTVDAMAASSLIVRAPDEENRRLVYIHLTPKGVSVATHCNKIREKFYKTQFERILDNEQQKDLLNVLRKLDNMLKIVEQSKE